jgi:hypothetical protein
MKKFIKALLAFSMLFPTVKVKKQYRVVPVKDGRKKPQFAIQQKTFLFWTNVIDKTLLKPEVKLFRFRNEAQKKVNELLKAA